MVSRSAQKPLVVRVAAHDAVEDDDILAGPARRGLALGLNEAAGYLGVAVTAFLTGALAASYAPQTVIWVGALAIALTGAIVSYLFVRDTGAHVAHEQRDHGQDGKAVSMRRALTQGTFE